MPNYDYVCSQCGYKEECFQKISDAPLIECPQCHQSTFKRGPGGGIGLQFQGSGFYITDYGDKSPSTPKEEGGGCGCGKPACDK